MGWDKVSFNKGVKVIRYFILNVTKKPTQNQLRDLSKALKQMSNESRKELKFPTFLLYSS